MLLERCQRNPAMRAAFVGVGVFDDSARDHLPAIIDAMADSVADLPIL